MTEMPQALQDAYARARELWVQEQLWEYSEAAESDSEVYAEESARYGELTSEREAAEAEVRRLEALWDEGKLE